MNTTRVADDPAHANPSQPEETPMTRRIIFPLTYACVALIIGGCGSSNADGLFGDSDAGTGSLVCGVELNISAGSTLTKEDDADGDCANGIQLDLEGTTSSLPDGTTLELSVDGEDPEEQEVEDGRVVFDGVTLPANGEAELELTISGDEDCSSTIMFRTQCGDAPSCEVGHPQDGDKLNGLPTDEGGDRSNDANDPFRTRVVIETDAADGELVLLDTGADTLAANVEDGQAVFAGVLLAPDGDYSLQAECFSGAASAKSDTIEVSVDAQGPELDIANIRPVAGQHFSLDDDVDPETDELEFEVCVPVTSRDALDLDGDGADNICVAVGTQEPSCAAATEGGLGDADGGCVTVECPGNASFDLNLEVKDASGNSTLHVIEGITCASELPMVQIVNLEDASDDPDDVSKRLLAASMPESQLRDQDADKAGAQHDVVACTNATEGSARLLVGLADGELFERAVLDQLEAAGDECPPDLPSVARFALATLTESAEQTDGSLDRMTQIRVEVTDQSDATNQSSAVNLWVDSAAPTVTLFEPTRSSLCDTAITAEEDVVRSFLFRSSAFPAELVVNVENGGTPGPDVIFTSQDDFLEVTLPLGTNVLHATTVEPSGNAGSLAECEFAVGDPPVVAWVSPPPGTTVLNASSTPPKSGTVQDADPDSAGWQGQLQVTIGNLQPGDVATGSVQFLANGEPIGDPVALADGTGDDTQRTLTLDTSTLDGGLADASGVALRAQVQGTQEINSATLRNLLIDTTVPTVVESPLVAIGPEPEDRRRTRFALTWSAAGDGVDGEVPVSAYDIAYSDAAITNQVEFDAAFNNVDLASIAGGTRVGAGTTPPGSDLQRFVDGLRIEQTYYFAVQALDRAGNRGPITTVDSEAPEAPGIRARFNSVILSTPVSNAEYGTSMDGSTDLTGDGLSELVVGSVFGNQVYIYKGEVDGYSDTPMVTITGPGGGTSGAWFGISVAVVGDVNADTPAAPSSKDIANAQDLVIVASNDTSGPTGAQGRAYVFYGRDWEDPSNQSLSVAGGSFDAVIDGDSPEMDFAGMSGVVRLGDYNGDGGADFALLAPFFDPTGAFQVEGGAFVVFGASAGAEFKSISLPSAVGSGAAVVIGAPFDSLGSTDLGAVAALGVSNLFGSGSSGLFLGNYFAGDLYAMKFDPVSPTLTTAEATATYDGAGLTGNYGIALSTGNVISATSPATDAGVVHVFRSSAGAPLPTPTNITDTSGVTYFGQILIGNAFSGRPGSYATSFIGSPELEDPDLLIGAPSSTSGGPPVLHLLSGSRLLSLSGTVDLASSPADTRIDLSQIPGAPAQWAGGLGAAIRDANGDGFGDIAISEFAPDFDPGNDPPPIDGQIIVLY